jgi:hypothetical protein
VPVVIVERHDAARANAIDEAKDFVGLKRSGQPEEERLRLRHDAAASLIGRALRDGAAAEGRPEEPDQSIPPYAAPCARLIGGDNEPGDGQMTKSE